MEEFTTVSPLLKSAINDSNEEGDYQHGLTSNNEDAAVYEPQEGSRDSMSVRQMEESSIIAVAEGAEEKIVSLGHLQNGIVSGFQVRAACL